MGEGGVEEAVLVSKIDQTHISIRLLIWTGNF